jgi:hypothetical protein
MKRPRLIYPWMWLVPLFWPFLIAYYFWVLVEGPWTP